MEWLPDLARAVPHERLDLVRAVPHERLETPSDEARPIRLKAHLGRQWQIVDGRSPGSHHIDQSPGPKGAIPAQRHCAAPRAANGSPIAVGADLHGPGLARSRPSAQLPNCCLLYTSD